MIYMLRFRHRHRELSRVPSPALLIKKGELSGWFEIFDGEQTLIDLTKSD